MLSVIGRLPDMVVASGYESPEQAVLRLERRDHLSASLAILTERERTALLLRDMEGLPAEEVAVQLSCSKATVRSRLPPSTTISWLQGYR